MREVQTHLERTARLTVAMTAVCVEESEKREGWSPKGKSTPITLSPQPCLPTSGVPVPPASTRAVLGKLASRANSHVISIS